MNAFTTYFRLSILLFVLLSINACQVDVVETDAELIPYFDLFAEEAAKRGIAVDYEAARIEGLIQSIPRSNVLEIEST